MTTFNELCAALKCTKRERRSLAEYLGHLRYVSTVNALADKQKGEG